MKAFSNGLGPGGLLGHRTLRIMRQRLLQPTGSFRRWSPIVGPRNLRSLLTICFVVVIGCSSVKDQPPTLHLSTQDRAQIEAVIKTETDEPILMLNPDSEIPNAVRVNTGFSSEAFSSSGRSFILRKTKKGWIVIFRGSWIS